MSELPTNPDVYDLNQARNYQFSPMPFAYTERDALLYALGVGVGHNPTDPHELPFVYEGNAANFRVLPTFAVIFPTAVLLQVLNLPGLRFNPMMLVHGEQTLELFGPLPPSASVTSTAKVGDIYDKGKGLLLTITAETTDDTSQQLLARNTYSLFIRGLGGFGGERGPSAAATPLPERSPDATYTQTTRPEQALLYRLTGDTNPLHADPSMAALGGFDRPILHGLCTFGFATRALIHTLANNDPARIQRLSVRFSKHVFPGETLQTELWQVSEKTIQFRTIALERGEEVLSNATAQLT